MSLWKQIAVAAYFCLVLPGLTFAAEQGALPRYSFSVGRRVTYAGHGEFDYTGGSFVTSSTVQLTVVGTNADGSYRIIVRTARRETQGAASQPATQPINLPEEVRYSRIDILPSGRVMAVAGGFEADAPPVLPPLPADEKELAGTWKSESRLPGATKVFRLAGPAAGNDWTFASSSEGLFKTIYGIADDSTYHFDAAKGLITSIDGRERQDYGFHGSGSDHIALQSDDSLSGAEAAALAKDGDALFAAQTDMDSKLRSISAPPDDSSEITVRICTAISSAMANIKSAEIEAQFQEMLSSVRGREQEQWEEVRRSTAVIDKPSPDFSAVDLAGQKHTLKDYRGKILVLDFWYRGCGWCMRAMPQMKQVAEDFKDKPVVVLGMNTDRDNADAQFVVDKMKLNYSTLRIDFETAGKFKVQGFPSLLVIDGGGVVRVFDEGYSPTLRADLDKKIKSLLDSAAPAPQPASTEPVGR
jgi:thiol-disulfide isomerase/thioredoxin